MSLLKKAGLFLGDALLLYIALSITLLIRYDAGGFSAHLADHLGPFSAIFIAWVFTFYLSDLYHVKSLSNAATLVKNLTLAVVVATGLSVGIFYLFSSFFELTPKTNLLIFGISFFILDYLWRLALLRAFASGAVGVILLGDSPRVRELAEHLKTHPHAGYRVAASFPQTSSLNLETLKHTVKETDAAFLVTQSNLAEQGVLHLIYRALPLGIMVVSFPDFYEMIFEKTPLEDVGEQWFVENVSTRRPFYDRVKRLTDVVLAALFFIILSPFMLLIWLAVTLTSRGPAIFMQQRIGKNGMPFTLYKFRIMIANHSGSPWTVKNDPRLTPVGKFLNVTHMNEFPQLVNILRGDISFTGPRPESAELVAQYQKFPFYEMRHVVKPGLTGWAQINYKPSASLEEAFEKLKYDLYYIKNRSLFLDLLIILKTIRYLFISLAS